MIARIWIDREGPRPLYWTGISKNTPNTASILRLAIQDSILKRVLERIIPVAELLPATGRARQQLCRAGVHASQAHEGARSRMS